MKSILYITNISNGVSSFSVTAVEATKRLGYEFHLAGNFSGTPDEKILNDEKTYGVNIHQIDLTRSPYSSKNITAYKQLVKLIKEENIDYIHCNTPVGGLLGRLAGKKCKVKKVIYQAHGFHFYKGAPLKNWLIYYPIEKLLAHYTDALITINKEDYERAQGFRLRNNGKVYYVPGVGIDLSQYELPENTRELKRKELGLKETDVAFISAGELNTNKNNRVIIEALGNLQNKNVHYFLCGVGPCEEELKDLAQTSGVVEQVHFLGYRTDIKELFRAADVFVMPSFREGLSRSIMEAMASGLPCIVSKIRGNVDLVEEGKGGYLCDPYDIHSFEISIENCLYDSAEAKHMGAYNKSKIIQYSSGVVEEKLKDIYLEIFK